MGLKSIIRQTYGGFLAKMLQLDPKKRANLNDLINDSIFDSVRDQLNLPCLKANPIQSLNCGSYLLRNQVPILSEPIHTNSLSDAIDLLFSVQKKFVIDYRTIVLAIYLLKFYSSSSSADPRIIGLTCLILATNCIEPYRISAVDINLEQTKNIPNLTHQIITMEIDLLESYGLDLYAATAFDILKTLSIYYSNKTFDASLSYLLLSSHANIINTTHEDLALTCLYLGCQITDDPFVHMIDKDTLTYIIGEIKKIIPDLLGLQNLDYYKVGILSIESLLTENKYLF